LFEPLWICMIFFIFILSVERLSIITNDQRYRQRVAILCRIMSIISTLMGIVFFITFLTPWVTMRYEVSTYAWRYIRSSVAFVVAMTEACSLTPLSLISLVNYIVISIAICHKIPSQESSRTCKTRNAPTFIIARNAKTYQEDNQNGSGMPTVLALARFASEENVIYGWLEKLMTN
uniref:G_PROTEIN_RECEP_F1_2 domain-containing protein n=1 Tax=Toxocara canis TaxID=6265 RepID=A0A183VFP2_TOXCA